MLATLALVLWIIGFYLVLKYRVHIHVNIETGDLSRAKRNRRDHRPGRSATRNDALYGSGLAVVRGSVVEAVAADSSSEIFATLVGLGCRKPRARQIAKVVCSQPGSFDELLRRAINEARAA